MSVLTYVEERCKLIDGCWIWQQSHNQHGKPVGYFGGKNIDPRREAYFASGGKRRHGCYLAQRCDNQSCCKPECQHWRKPKTVFAEASRAGLLKRGADSLIRYERAARAKSHVKLDMTKALDIRNHYAAHGNARRTAREMGLRRETVRAVVKGRTWKDRSNPFQAI